MDRINILLISLVFWSSNVLSEVTFASEKNALDICRNIENGWKRSSVIAEKRKRASNFLSTLSLGKNKTILIEFGAPHFIAYSYRAFVLENDVFNFVYYENKKNGYKVRKISYAKEPSASFLLKLFSGAKMAKIVMSMEDIPESLLGTCYKVTLKDENNESSFFYINTGIDRAINIRSNSLGMNANSTNLELMNYLVHFMGN